MAAATSSTKTTHPNHKTLHLFRREHSKFWWCGFHHKGTYYRTSTKATTKTEALTISEEWYFQKKAEFRVNGAPKKKSNEPTMKDAAMSAMKDFNSLVSKGERSQQYVKKLRETIYNIVLADGSPFIGVPVSEVDNALWHKFKRWVNETKPATSFRTFHQYRNAVSACLNAALREGWISQLPSFKDFSQSNQGKMERVWFRPAEVKKLRKELKDNIDRERQNGKRHTENAKELRDYVEFMLATGLRVGESKGIRFCDIERRFNKKENKYYLMIFNIKGKTRTGSCKSDFDAHDVFTRIVNRVKPEPNESESTQKIFQKHHHEGFNAVLNRIGLKFDAHGRKRDFISLRHTYISNKVLAGVPSNTIANNCRTSTYMIDNHYAKWLEPEMNQQIHRHFDYVDDSIQTSSLEKFFNKAE